ncbi:Rab-GTPase-TBC domain [Dillenia turbinata]|uniref:Rab-GTPase-TBC domain n=1 Tax=Dillenia turbinata TaxID=194707 RepID=A0AAN8Z8D8_9MAGN
MAVEREGKQWSCGKGSTRNLQRVSSIVRDIGEPCLHQSPIKVNKMLNPEKWQSSFDNEGKVFGFQKALKLIILGQLRSLMYLFDEHCEFEAAEGVDPSIRPEVWEFLLGCYAVGSTAESRRQLRLARRERYKDLIRQCQMMHSSIGTGSLAYVVGSKVMDMRTMSKNDGRGEAGYETRQVFEDSTNKSDKYCNWNSNCTDMSSQRQSSSDSGDLVSVRASADSAAYDSSFINSSSDPYNCSSLRTTEEAKGSNCATQNYFDFPQLPFMDLFEKSEEKETEDCKLSRHRKSKLSEESMHSFQINNNVDLIIESNGSPSNNGSHPANCEVEMICPVSHEPHLKSCNLDYKAEIVHRMRISDVPDIPAIAPTTSQGQHASEERVSEWLWTLHRIVVDVVRTDSHLEFYEDPKNLARMSDILSVYAWVDPATGYCQGMSDLVSPFVVLFEDNADAFWCFEMLLRRMRENFQMEGPTGVMKQLQALWHILERTDREMFAHLSQIGAESLHFAFRMLLVLFRRELSFNESLRMWEMMWAADFDAYAVFDLEENCLGPLVVQLPRDSGPDIAYENAENSNGSSKGVFHTKRRNGARAISGILIKSLSSHPFCGLRRSLWSRNDHLPVSNVISAARNGDDELPVFCVGAILILNRHKIIRDAHSFDDLIKAGYLYLIFNDRMLKIRVKRCIRTAIKLRKKYFYKLIKSKSPAAPNRD